MARVAVRAVPRWWVFRQWVVSAPAREGALRIAVTTVLIGVWVVAVLLALLTSTEDLTCTAADPSVCGPDVGSAWIGLAFATPVLLWWRPRLGAVAGMPFAVAEVLYDTDPAGHGPFVVHGVLCAVGFVVLRRRWSSSVARLDTAPAPPHRYFDDREPFDLGRWVNGPARLMVVGWVLAVLAVVCGGWYAALIVAEGRHIAQAVRVTGVVAAVSDSGSDSDSDSDVVPAVTVRLPLPGGGVRTSSPVEVWDTGIYPVGATVPVLVDPHDAGWVRLVAEPRDSTGWVVGATFFGTLALAVGVDRVTDRLRARRSRPRVGVRRR